MSPAPGTRLGPYEIVSRIGAGGMGEVFHARDTRLDRSVAVKILPAELARNAQLKLRFEREARAISQLNHPHICTLYDVGDGYLVMELLDGETLADRLARGPLPLADVLKYGAQIADALARAHRAGIVHRDLKPGNVMLTKSGAKLLDFGLAKTTVPQLTPDGTTMAHDKPLTQEGTILGTFQYMAPEQLEAEEADARTDIFALGAVLYEMLTGRRAFEGKSRTSLIAAIVSTQPQPVSDLAPLTPPALEHVIRTCLEKDREDRWQSAHDVAEELKWIATAPAATQAPSSRVPRLAMAAAVALPLVLAAIAAAAWLRARSAPAPRTAFAVLAPEGFRHTGHLISPDGTMLAYSATNGRGEEGIWLRRTDAIEAVRLVTAPESSPVSWSPDSKWIAYIAVEEGVRQLRRIAVTGGAPEVIASPFPHMNGNAAWAPDGTLLYCRIFGEGLSALRPGSDPVRVTTLDSKRRESVHTWPQFLSDGKHFLYLVHTVADRKNEIWAGSLDGKVKKMILRADSLVGVARSHLHYVRDGAIYAQPFDEDDLTLTGEARRLVDRVHFDEPSFTASAFVARSGALLYVPIRERTVAFGWYDRDGRLLEKLFEERNTIPTSLSRDGRKVAVLKRAHAKGATDIYVVDLVRGISTRLTAGLSNNQGATWAPAGDRIFFASDRDGPYDLYVQAEDGLTPAQPVWKSARDKDLCDVSRSGETLLVAEETADQGTDLWLAPVGAPEKRRPLATTAADEHGGSFSPDGTWAAYVSDRSGRQEVYARRVDGGPTTQISTNGARAYIWGKDNSEIYIRTLANERLLIPLTYDGASVVPGKPGSPFPTPARDYAMIAVREKGIAMWSIPDPSDYISVLHYDSAPPLPE